MGKINILPAKVYNRIAAGEVVDRPYSVVKELVENSIDAGATEIEIFIEKGGKQLIRVTDNGSGIEREDLQSAFLPHATSKIAKAEDLESILTLGFRGEAVASIASVSKMTVTSKTKDGKCYSLSSNGGELGEIEYENFNAAAGKLEIEGVSVHPGSAKNKMKNAIEIFSAFQEALPKNETPATTEGYEGFYMADEVSGSVESLTARYIIRDHDRTTFEKRKAHFLSLAEKINAQFGGNYIKATVTDSYFNMQEIISSHMHLIESAKKVMEEAGVTPHVCPIRGGTDGARLSFMGLPCPNLSTGGLNFHGRQEYIPVKSLYKMTEILIALAKHYAK